MKVAEYRCYGPPEVITICEKDRPRAEADEILIRIRATTVSSGDARMRAFKVNPLMWLPMRFYLGLRKPKKPVLGFTFSGTVEQVGESVEGCKEGDQLFGSTGISGGAHAEYLCLPKSTSFLSKPEIMSHEDAACFAFGGTTSYHFLKKAKIKDGDKVLVYGASGALGTAAVQIAKYFGAEVTAVCSAPKMELVKDLGADHVLDYTQKNFRLKGRKYYAIFDTVGKSHFGDCISSLTPTGKYLRAVHMELIPLFRGIWVNMTSKKRVIGGIAEDTHEALRLLLQMYHRAKYKPVIDSVYPLDEIVAAHARVDSGRKCGNVVIKIMD